MVSDDETVNGPKAAARILNSLPEGNRKRLIDRMKTTDPVVLARVLRNVVVFEDIVDLTAQGVQLLIKETDHTDLVLAISVAEPEISNFLFSNMSERKGQLVREDLELAVNAAPSDVNGAKKRIVQTLDRLRELGLVRTGGDDDVYV